MAGHSKIFPPPLLVLLFDPGFGIRDPRSGIRDQRSEIRDPGFWMDKNQDPGFGINVPDPQHVPENGLPMLTSKKRIRHQKELGSLK